MHLGRPVVPDVHTMKAGSWAEVARVAISAGDSGQRESNGTSSLRAAPAHTRVRRPMGRRSRRRAWAREPSVIAKRGLVCSRMAWTSRTPKSELTTTGKAPSFTAARKAVANSGELGICMSTGSPGDTPSSFKPRAKPCTLPRSSR